MFTAAVTFADLALYQVLIVPRLTSWKCVPFVWWAIVLAPVAIAVPVVERRTTNLFDVLSAGIAAAVCTTCHATWAARAGQPGHLKSLVLESPWTFWLVEPVVVFIVFVLLVGVTH